jgi:hypothetical protein
MVPSAFSLRGKNARQQFDALLGIYNYSLMDFHGEVVANHEAIFAHFPYWESLIFEGAVPKSDGEQLLTAIREVWSGAFPLLHLGVMPKQG